ncbi:zincin-like metallopeptidase domain-containing protein [Caballeronia sp. LZ065]|uniref:ArdC family protein n=1 Tax=Caballeronia sp. LZ065 TaxID=3038571 RepID=UPI00285564BD|nr:zincin-like metallopeptidase domain-containing protein [Caballeronia sp. LZ065]MDR5784575.1 zincin-like metallopeptidase domain-containing protein [Caballeronia sp. LZ065]
MKAQTKTPLPDVYGRVTDKIIADLEQGVRPWVKPWKGGNAGGRITLPVRHNGLAYQGINILLLWGEQLEKGFQSNRWMTFKQAQALGANVRKGEHGTLVVYANKVAKTDTDDNGDEIEREIPFMKGYTVFNVDQIENLTADYRTEPVPADSEPLELIEHAEAFFAKTGAVIRHGGDKAYYAPAQDIVQLPIPESFDTAQSYAATKAHEITHWTSHKNRLDRQLGKRFGDDAYSAEELIAEMGAAFLCAQLGLTPAVREDHAAYLDHWLKVLKADKRAIFTAASQAQKACEFLFSLQDENEQQAA